MPVGYCALRRFPLSIIVGKGLADGVVMFCDEFIRKSAVILISKDIFIS